MDCSPPGSSVHGDSPGRNTGVNLPCPPPGDLPNPGMEPRSPALQAGSLPAEPPGKPRFNAGYHISTDRAKRTVRATMLLSFSTSPAFSFDPTKWQHLEPPDLVPGSHSCLSSCPIPLSRNLILSGTSQVALVVKNLPVMQETQETQLQSLGWEDPLEEVMATHFSILAWEIPWAEKPGGLQSMGPQRVGHA